MKMELLVLSSLEWNYESRDSATTCNWIHWSSKFWNKLFNVTKCESQIEASWTALKAWKSGYKSYLNKDDVLFNKIGFIPINMFVIETWEFPMCLIL
ncbi:hypothetical protein HanIR_Chr05g0249851 [Helianthus annuus]|nr:hypothetical protein HanIR_Chr05g0249851 [Helianthus annuus]